MIQIHKLYVEIYAVMFWFYYIQKKRENGREIEKVRRQRETERKSNLILIV